MISWAFNPWAMPKDGHVRITIAITVRKPNTVAHVHHMNECPSNIQVRDVSFEKNKCLPTCDNLCFLIALVSHEWTPFPLPSKHHCFQYPVAFQCMQPYDPHCLRSRSPIGFEFLFDTCENATGRMAASDHAGVVLMSVSVYGTLRDSTALLMWRCLLHFDMTIESMESWLHLTLLPLENGRKLDTWHSRMPLSRHLATASEPLSYNILHNIFEGSLEVKLPTIWTVEKQRWEESGEKRSEERRCRCAKR